MGGDFNKAVFFSNISFLLKERGMKIGEFETEAGVSPGYISRSSKEEGSSKPGIDFILKAASVLGVSVDALLSIDLSCLSPTESYLASFLGKLDQNTMAGLLDWQCEAVSYLMHGLREDFNGYCGHPLFSRQLIYVKTDMEYPDQREEIVFPSASYGAQTLISGNCYNLTMDGGATLYIMNICENNLIHGNAPHVLELWMVTANGNEFICSTNGSVALSDLMWRLYSTVTEFGDHPKVNSEIRAVIDAFMRDGKEYIPF